jgi:hypothetical protein
VTVRLAYRVSYLVFLVSGHLAAWLAADFRALARASQRWGVLTVVLQLPVLMAWSLSRAVSLATFGICQALALRLS